jgi:hypothetical protein
MKSRQAPVLAAKKTHWVVGRDCCAAAIAHVPEARTAPPQLDRVRSGKQTAFDPMSNEFPNDIRNHDGSVSTSAIPIKMRPWYRGLDSAIPMEYAVGIGRLSECPDGPS